MPDANYSAVATADVSGFNTGATQTGGYASGFIFVNVRNLSFTNVDAPVSLAIFR
jgi:hypothetical protein